MAHMWRLNESKATSPIVGLVVIVLGLYTGLIYPDGPLGVGGSMLTIGFAIVLLLVHADYLWSRPITYFGLGASGVGGMICVVNGFQKLWSLFIGLVS